MYNDICNGDITEKDLHTFRDRKVAISKILDKCFGGDTQSKKLVNIVETLIMDFKKKRREYKKLCTIQSWLIQHNLYDGKNTSKNDGDAIENKKITLNDFEEVLKGFEIALPKQVQDDIEFFHSHKSVLFDEIAKHFIENGLVILYLKL